MKMKNEFTLENELKMQNDTINFSICKYKNNTIFINAKNRRGTKILKLWLYIYNKDKNVDNSIDNFMRYDMTDIYNSINKTGEYDIDKNFFLAFTTDVKYYELSDEKIELYSKIMNYIFSNLTSIINEVCRSKLLDTSYICINKDQYIGARFGISPDDDYLYRDEDIKNIYKIAEKVGLVGINDFCGFEYSEPFIFKNNLSSYYLENK